jgi:hypothetical protein
MKWFCIIIIIRIGLDTLGFVKYNLGFVKYNLFFLCIQDLNSQFVYYVDPIEKDYLNLSMEQKVALVQYKINSKEKDYEIQSEDGDDVSAAKHG